MVTRILFFFFVLQTNWSCQKNIWSTLLPLDSSSTVHSGDNNVIKTIAKWRWKCALIRLNTMRSIACLRTTHKRQFVYGFPLFFCFSFCFCFLVDLCRLRVGHWRTEIVLYQRQKHNMFHAAKIGLRIPRWIFQVPWMSFERESVMCSELNADKTCSAKQASVERAGLTFTASRWDNWTRRQNGNRMSENHFGVSIMHLNALAIVSHIKFRIRTNRFHSHLFRFAIELSRLKFNSRFFMSNELYANVLTTQNNRNNQRKTAKWRRKTTVWIDVNCARVSKSVFFSSCRWSSGAAKNDRKKVR